MIRLNKLDLDFEALEMKRFFLISWLIFTAILPTGARERAPLASILPVFEAYVEKARIAEDVPGVVVVIVKDGKIAYLKGFGVKVAGKSEPVDGHTPFAVASVTKNFTNTLVARLVDQGKLKWTDPVSKYLPDFSLNDPKVSQELKVEDLLSHRSGLPGFAGDSLIELGWSASEIIPAMKKIPMEGEFRKDYNYQNILVGIVENILEKVTGKTLAQLYQKELFQPLDLKETRFGETSPPNFWQKFLNLFQKADSQPTFHDFFGGKTRYLPKGNPALFTLPASSGIISTGHDMGKWLIFQLNKAAANGTPLVSETNMKEMRTPHVDIAHPGRHLFPKNRVTKVQYGLGWFIHNYADAPVLSHMGGMAGTRAVLYILPEDNVGIAIMTNLGGMRVSLFPEAICDKFLDLYLKAGDEQDWAKVFREDTKEYRAKYEKQRRLEMLQNLAPSQDLESYIGIYENALYGKVHISKSGDSLILIYKDRPQVTLSHWNGNAFQFNGSDLSPGFVGTDQGEIIFSAGRGKSDRMMINLFREGKDELFHRVD
jgi:CubicO group peptidase (beta-lactamase class C family)